MLSGVRILLRIIIATYKIAFLYTCYIFFLILHRVNYYLRSIISFSFRLVVWPSCRNIILISTVYLSSIKVGKISTHWKYFLFWRGNLIIECFSWILSISINPLICFFSISNVDVIFNSRCYIILCFELCVILV